MGGKSGILAIFGANESGLPFDFERCVEKLNAMFQLDNEDGA